PLVANEATNDSSVRAPLPTLAANPSATTANHAAPSSAGHREAAPGSGSSGWWIGDSASAEIPATASISPSHLPPSRSSSPVHAAVEVPAPATPARRSVRYSPSESHRATRV